jgi:hypothetical protein
MDTTWIYSLHAQASSFATPRWLEVVKGIPKLEEGHHEWGVLYQELEDVLIVGCVYITFLY